LWAYQAINDFKDKEKYEQRDEAWGKPLYQKSTCGDHYEFSGGKAYVPSYAIGEMIAITEPAFVTNNVEVNPGGFIGGAPNY
jgi:hypothetical protein